MKKSDIRNGMHVITNDGVEYIIIGGVEAQAQIRDNHIANTIMVQVHSEGWMLFDDYDNDLHYHDPEGDEYDDEEDWLYDIKEVYSPLYYANILSSVDKHANKFTKVWERPRKKMTQIEIERELGYAIEIMDDERLRGGL